MENIIPAAIAIILIIFLTGCSQNSNYSNGQKSGMQSIGQFNRTNWPQSSQNNARWNGTNGQNRTRNFGNRTFPGNFNSTNRPKRPESGPIQSDST